MSISDEFFLSVHHMRLVVALATRKLAHWFIISLYGVQVPERRCFVLPRCTWSLGAPHKVLMCGHYMSPECYILYIHWTLWYAYCYSSSLGFDSSVLFCVGQCSHLIVLFWLLRYSYCTYITVMLEYTVCCSSMILQVLQWCILSGLMLGYTQTIFLIQNLRHGFFWFNVH